MFPTNSLSRWGSLHRQLIRKECDPFHYSLQCGCYPRSGFFSTSGAKLTHLSRHSRALLYMPEDKTLPGKEQHLQKILITWWLPQHPHARPSIACLRGSGCPTIGRVSKVKCKHTLENTKTKWAPTKIIKVRSQSCGHLQRLYFEMFSRLPPAPVRNYQHP